MVWAKRNRLSQCKYWCKWAGIALLLLLVLWVSAAMSHSGYSIDPTDPGNFFTAILKNDTPQPLQATWINDCVGPDKDKCGHGALIQPNQNAQFTEPRGGAVRYNIYDSRGRFIKCLEITPSQAETQGKSILYLSKHTNCE